MCECKKTYYCSGFYILIELVDLVITCNIPSKEYLLGVSNVSINWYPVMYFTNIKLQNDKSILE